MKKKVVIKSCENCMFIRNMAGDNPYCCIKKIMLMADGLPYHVKNIKRIPRWCPLPDDE